MNPRFLCCVLLLAIGLALAQGCGKQGTTTMDDVKKAIAENLPAGWQVAFAREASFTPLPPTQPDDLVVFKTERALLEPRRPATEPSDEPQVLHFAVSAKPYIDPAKYPELWRKNEEIRADHERVLRQVASMPRNTKGELMPRGDNESETVAKVMAEYKALPPFDADMATHHFEGVGLKLRDFRGTLVPRKREFQQEMNQVFVAINTAVQAYKH